MKKATAHEVRPGRMFMGRLAHGQDIITAVEEFCSEHRIEAAELSLIGAVTKATIGAYDQQQQVYITFQKEEPLEIVSCMGNVSYKEGKPFVHAHILLGDEQGQTIGGHLFSDTIIFAGEMVLQELTGTSFQRLYDQTTGLMLWDFPLGG